MSPTIKNDSPLNEASVLVVMGVSGCGKSTLAQALADKLAIDALDADDFHPPENKARMASGQPLTDEMRLPWVERLRDHLQALCAKGQSCTLAFSGLRRAHREKLRIANGRVVFFHLLGEKGVIAERMNARTEHFMPTSLLDSQFDALESTSREVDVIPLDLQKPVDELCAEALAKLIELNQ